ncbi:MAG: hypothetical protein AAGK05_19795, partial [Pseudomonadota bacterium]
ALGLSKLRFLLKASPALLNVNDADTNVEIRARYSAQGLYQILESYKQLLNEFTLYMILIE